MNMVDFGLGALTGGLLVFLLGNLAHDLHRAAERKRADERIPHIPPEKRKPPQGGSGTAPPLASEVTPFDDDEEEEDDDQEYDLKTLDLDKYVRRLAKKWTP